MRGSARASGAGWALQNLRAQVRTSLSRGGGQRCPLGAESSEHPPRGFQAKMKPPASHRDVWIYLDWRRWRGDFSSPQTLGTEEGGLRGAGLNKKDETHTPQTGHRSTKPASGSAGKCARAEGRGGACAGHNAMPGQRKDGGSGRRGLRGWR